MDIGNVGSSMFAAGSYVRFETRIYHIYIEYSLVYFVEYHIAKVTKVPRLEADFYLSLTNHEYHDFKHDDLLFRRSMYNRVVKEAKILADNADVEREFQDCLRAIYRLTISRQVSRQEVAERERIHRRRLRSCVEEAIVQTARFVYSLAGTHHEIGTVTMRCPETELTEKGQFAVLYEVPNLDGKQRSSYADYLRYIFAQEFEESEDATEEMGPKLVQIFSNIFPSLRFDWRAHAENILPVIYVTIDVGKSEVLM
jgi:hypothetical protein